MTQAPLYDPSRATYDPATEKRVAALLVGAIDTHVHTGPSIAPRGLDHYEMARDASEVGYTAFVTKDHDYAGVMTAALIHAHHPELKTKVYSSVVLNNVVGGLNPYAVEHTAAMGGKVCWLPTLAAENHFRWEKDSGRKHIASTEKIRPASIVPAMNADGSIRDDMLEIIDVLARTGMAMATGHLHVSEIWKIVEEAKRRGVEKIIITHPEDFIQATLNDVAGFANLGAYSEHSLNMFVEGSKFQRFTPDDMRAQIEAAGVDYTILATDGGQKGHLHPIEIMRRGIKLCIDLGYSDADIRKMVSINPAKAIGIESELPKAA